MIIPEILFMYPEKLMDYMTENKISVIFWVPTVMISVANGGVLENADLSALKLILFAILSLIYGENICPTVCM